VVVVLAILGIVGARLVSNYLARKAGDKIASSLLSGATGGNVDVSSGGNGVNITGNGETLQAGDQAKWPSDMPAVVPKFTYGTISASVKTTTNGNAWSVIYDKVTDGALDKYKNELTAKGWTEDAQTNLGIANTLMMTSGNYQLTLAVDEQNKGANLAVTTKTQ